MSIKNRIKNLESISPEEPTILFINDSADSETVGYQCNVMSPIHQHPNDQYFIEDQESIEALEERIYEDVKDYSGAAVVCFGFYPWSNETIEHFGESGVPLRSKSELEKLKIKTHGYGQDLSEYLQTPVSHQV